MADNFSVTLRYTIDAQKKLVTILGDHSDDNEWKDLLTRVLGDPRRRAGFAVLRELEYAASPTSAATVVRIMDLVWAFWPQLQPSRAAILTPSTTDTAALVAHALADAQGMPIRAFTSRDEAMAWLNEGFDSSSADATRPPEVAQEHFEGAIAPIEQALRASDAMGARHMAIVKREFEAVANGDLGAVLQNAHGDVTLDIFAPPEFPWVRQAKGINALREVIAHNFESVIEQHPSITNVFAEQNAVVLFGRERGRIRETGVPYEMEFVETFTFREGKLANVRVIAAHTKPT
jgi:ketosteroid isomerase-like protein